MLALLALACGTPHADPAEDYRQGIELYRAGDLVTSMAPLRRAADAGHVEAQLQLAYILDWSEENADAVRYYRMASDAGNPRGMYHLALMINSGEGVEPDQETARALLEQAVALDSPEAMLALGFGYLDGTLGLTVDEAAARALFRRALDLGYGRAQQAINELARREAARQAAEPPQPVPQ